jgi:hypothetical protein
MWTYQSIAWTHASGVRFMAIGSGACGRSDDAAPARVVGTRADFKRSQVRQAGCQVHDVVLSDLCLPERSDADLKFEIPSDAQKRICPVGQVMAMFANERSFSCGSTIGQSGPRLSRAQLNDDHRQAARHLRPMSLRGIQCRDPF